MGKEKFEAKNISKIERDELIFNLEKLREYVNKDEQQTINQVIRKLKDESKLGLNFEHFEEEIDQILKDNIPVLKEVDDKKINKSESLDYNFLIEGDNLPALQLLNKTHKGKIDVIYIDPPYNTGKDLIYNDSFVDKEDPYIHSKWLSFIEKRLTLAKNLLSEDGIIFISIDDREVYELKILCDSIFGVSNFVNNIVVHSNPGGNKQDGIERTKQYMLCYCKETSSFSNLGEEIILNKKEYKLKDDKSYYKKGSQLEKWGNDCTPHTHPNLAYSIYYNPKTKEVKTLFDYNHEEINKDRTKEIRYEKESEYLINDGFYCIRPEKSNKGECRRWRVEERTFLSRLADDEFIFEKKGESFKIYEKERLKEKKFKKMKDFIPAEIGGQSSDLTNILGKVDFDFPKPVKLIKFILNNYYKNDITVLDFFAGSGTTAQAVLELNQEDSGNRKFILVDKNEKNICENITYPRIKKVIEGYDIKEKTIHGIKENLIYQKIDFINEEFMDIEKGEYLSDELINYCKELIELKHMCELNTKGVYYANSNEEMSNIILNNEVTDIYYSKDEFNITKNNMINLNDKNINIHVIPNCFYEKELRENGEL